MKKKKQSKTTCCYIFAGIIMLLLIINEGISTYKNAQEQQIQHHIASEIIRFHILANSDTKKDQELKLQVKEKVVTCLQKKLKTAKNIHEARNILQSSLKEVESVASNEIKKQGYSYGVEASLKNTMFPVKQYGDLVFPAGEYEALRVQIGESKGKNWWCVMFPTLCFIDGTYNIVPEESKMKLKNVLSKEDYNALLIKNKEDVKIEFKLINWWKNQIN